MQYRSVFLLIFLAFSFGAIAQPQLQLYFPALTQKMGLKTPVQKEDNYEIRVWKKCQLCYGEAHILYQLTKNRKELSLSKYTMRFDKQEFIGAEKAESKIQSLDELWHRLMQQDLLTLPDQAAIYEELHPRPQKDSTWNTIGPDGSISVHAKKKKRSSIWIGDGESYHFEIFTADGFRTYAYSNPDGYVKARPDIDELRKVVSILDELSAAF